MPPRRFFELSKRMDDILVSAAGLVFLAPLFLYISWRIKRDSPGPAFFWGSRMGRDGKTFRILKFRTMYHNDESSSGPKITGQGDARVTPTGKWLRDNKLNELPQLWNVLKGEMSLVGPRPEDPEIVAAWPAEARRLILSVRPGITSPASVLYRDEEQMLAAGNVMDDYLRGVLPTKLRLDSVYVRNRSFACDMDVIFWTLVAIFPPMRTKEIPASRLFWGPLARFLNLDFSWFMADLPASFLAVSVVGLVWRSAGPLDLGWRPAVLVAFFIAISFSIVNGLTGINKIIWSKAPPGDMIFLAASTAFVSAILLALNYSLFPLWLPNVLPPAMLLATGLVCFLGFVAVRFRSRILTGIAARWPNVRPAGRWLGEHVLIVGAGEVGQFAVWLIRKGKLSQLFSIAGFVDDDPRKQGMRIDSCNVLGTTDQLVELVAEHDAGLILFAIEKISKQERKRILDRCAGVPARVILIPDILHTMRAYFRAENHDRQDHPAGEVQAGPSPIDLAGWLLELEELALAQDNLPLQEKIAALKSELMADGRILE